MDRDDVVTGTAGCSAAGRLADDRVVPVAVQGRQLKVRKQMMSVPEPPSPVTAPRRRSRCRSRAAVGQLLPFAVGADLVVAPLP